MREGEPIELVLTLDKPAASIRPGDNLILTKDGHVTNDLLTISSIDAGKCQVTFNVPQASLADSASYKLLWAESPLAETRVLVRPRALELTGELSANKSEYVEGDTIELRFGVSRPIVDLSTVSWLLNDKAVRWQAHTLSFEESVYGLTVATCAIGTHDGTYTVRIQLDDDDDEKQELSSSMSAPVVIKERAVRVLSSNWRSSMCVGETRRVVLTCRIDRHLSAAHSGKDLLVYKDATLLAPNSDELIEIQLENGADPTSSSHWCDVRLVFTRAMREHSGKYRLCLKNQRRDLLATTQLTVIGVTRPLAACKPQQTAYEQDEQISLSFALSAPLVDARSCVEWTRNAQVIANANTIVDDDECNVYKLVVADACQFATHAGEYGVRVRSEPLLSNDDAEEDEDEAAAAVFYTAAVKVVILAPPIRVLEPLALKNASNGSNLVDESKPMRLTCRLWSAEASAAAAFEWRLNGRPIDDAVCHAHADGTHELSVASAQPSHHSGLYELIAPAGGVRLEPLAAERLRCEVRVRPALKIVRDLKRVEPEASTTPIVDVGTERVLLSVELSREPSDDETLKWFKDGTLLSSASSTSTSLTLTNLKLSDSGRYWMECGESGLRSGEVVLDVRVPLGLQLRLAIPSHGIEEEEEKDKERVTHLSVKASSLGEFLLFECESTRDLAAYTWHMNDTPLSDDQTDEKNSMICSTKEPSPSSSATLYKLSVLKCVVFKQEQAAAAAPRSFYLQLANAHKSNTISLRVLDDTPPLEPLVIEGEHIHEGGQCVLVAKVASPALADMAAKWLHNGKAITSPRFKPTVDATGDEIKLLVDNLQLADAGLYELQLSGDGNRPAAAYQLVVQPLALRIVKPLNCTLKATAADKKLEAAAFTFMANKSLNLDEAADTYRIEWFKDSVKLTTKDKKYATHALDEKKTSHVLTVSDVQLLGGGGDHGVYEVRVSEASGKGKVLATSQASLDKPPKFKKDKALEVSKQRAECGETITLSANLDKPLDGDDGRYALEWRVNGKPLAVGSNSLKQEFKLSSESDEAALVEAVLLVKMDEPENSSVELERVSLRLDKPMRMIGELRCDQAKYKPDATAVLTCELAGPRPDRVLVMMTPQGEKKRKIASFTLNDDATKLTKGNYVLVNTWVYTHFSFYL